jgi:endoglucanase
LLQGVSHPWDVYAVSTSQEEVGGIGAITSTYKIYPNVGIAIDVTQGDMPGCPEADTFPLTKGPAIAFGPNIHSQIFERLVEIANAEEIPHQIAPHPGPTGTDAYFIQIAREGIPTGLVSIPLRYMHTPVETVATVDIERAARLLAKFIETIGELKL